MKLYTIMQFWNADPRELELAADEDGEGFPIDGDAPARRAVELANLTSHMNEEWSKQRERLRGQTHADMDAALQHDRDEYRNHLTKEKRK